MDLKTDISRTFPGENTLFVRTNNYRAITIETVVKLLQIMALILQTLRLNAAFSFFLK